MADLGGTFDSTQVEPQGDYEAIPAGNYTAVITDSEWKDTKTPGGRYLNLTYKIQGGAYDGRLVWQMLNLVNRNEKAVQIANSQLSAICQAVGKPAVSDSEELHHIPVSIKIVIKRDEQYGDRNEIKAVKNVSNAPSPSSNVAAAQSQQQSGKAPPAFMQRAS